ncbi:MAG TPA: organomercurial lyase [Actinomycetota bacterium]|nr:organomercurial lyase [Actinomycetota bacterium]
MGPDTLWWGGCAWDAFAIPNLVPNSPSVLFATTCPACKPSARMDLDQSGTAGRRSGCALPGAGLAGLTGGCWGLSDIPQTR